ncbi:hypothetical protein [Ilumatobacter sp.]|uniref:hypothetical protein n=1 Tax=Ilumatobacter sp. TaxID=1967498 RepID=UPI0037528009
MSNQKTSALAPFAAVAGLLGLCCGLPLLASVGVLGAVAGIGLGSWLVVAFAVAVVAVGVVRWRRTSDTCPAPEADVDPSPLRKDAVLSPTRTSPNEEESS